MFKVVAAWPSRELSHCGVDLLIVKLPECVPRVSNGFVQAMLLLGLELISLKLAWICLDMMQSHFWLQRDMLCHFSLGSF